MITFLTRPSAGEYFKFDIFSKNKEVYFHKVWATINEEEIFNKVINCDDPPCHEMFFISKKYSNRLLNVFYQNNIEHTKKFSFFIL